MLFVAYDAMHFKYIKGHEQTALLLTSDVRICQTCNFHMSVSILLGYFLNWDFNTCALFNPNLIHIRRKPKWTKMKSKPGYSRSQ